MDGGILRTKWSAECFNVTETVTEEWKNTLKHFVN
jgi:hypothetical protein